MGNPTGAGNLKGASLLLPKSEASSHTYQLHRQRRRSVKSTIVSGSKLLILLTCAVTFSIISPSGFSLFSSNRQVSTEAIVTIKGDPASEWKDDVWPIREQTPWDISTDFPYPRILEYDVTEGTWLRLDVHPTSSDIVFDMLGDVYCLPAREYISKKGTDEKVRAVPVLLGVPHDSDPHFSPDGKSLVFRSDAGLGVENIWIKPWSGCSNMDLRPIANSNNNELAMALAMKAKEDAELAAGVSETAEKKERRLLREGRAEARRITNETYRWVSDARFHASGEKVIATKWYTSTRSLGAGEAWEYETAPTSDIISAGSGKRIIGRTLPPGWDASQYGDQQIGPEQAIWKGDDVVIYSKNIIDEPHGTFEYSKDVHSGIYAIFGYNLTTGRTETLVGSSPGGASRPELSRDGRTLAFVRRVRDKEALVLKDLETGTIHQVWYGLTYDTSAVSAPMGTYPSFAFTPSDEAVVVWAAGQIWSVPLTTNAQGEKVSSLDAQPFPIPFTAHIEKRLAETRRNAANISPIGNVEQGATQRVYAFNELRADAHGKRVLFDAAGVTYVQEVGVQALPSKVPVLYEEAAYYSPSFVYGTDDLVIHARWSDTQFTTFELSSLSAGTAYEVEGLPMGRYFSPVLCECEGNERTLAFIKTAADVLTGNIVATARPGLYFADLALPSETTVATAKNLRFVPSEISGSSYETSKLQFTHKNKKLLVSQSDKSFEIDLEAPAPAGSEHAFNSTMLAAGKMTTEVVVSPQFQSNFGLAAFVDFYQVYITSLKNVNTSGGEELWSKPGNATKGIARLSLDGGHDLTWSRDGHYLFWFLGPYLHTVKLHDLHHCNSAINESAEFGLECTQKYVKWQEVIVEHPTDVARLREDALAVADPDAREDADVLFIVNATLLTMIYGSLHDDLVHDGVVVTKGGVIEAIGTLNNIEIPPGSTTIDAEGGFVVPGYIDVHAHWDGVQTLYPASSWEHETFLAFGVTTMHNPSSDNVLGFTERSRVESGKIIGPRIFQTGTIIYGAGGDHYHQDIADMQEAYSALTRIKVEGGPASFSYKNYNLPIRASRQRLLLAAKNMSMLCFPEGGMNWDWDLTYIIDGMTTVEHALPVSELYDDVITLYALSGTGSTPTHIVNYGGAWGEQLVWAKGDVANDPKLRQFIRHDELQELSESIVRPHNSFALFNTSASVAKMVKKGLLTHIGAHGEPPLGLNYHAEMFYAFWGLLDNYEVLKAATSSAAVTLGLQSSIGSLAPRKFADFLIYPPGYDIIHGDINLSRNMKYVARGGRLWNASTMEEIWPVKGRKQSRPPINAD